MQRMMTQRAAAAAAAAVPAMLQRCTAAAAIAPARRYSMLAGSATAAAAAAAGVRAPASSTSCSALPRAPASPWAPSASAAPRGCRSMFIQTQSTPNPNSLKFLPGRDVSPGGSTHDFSSYREASARSPLAALLFGIEGVRGVYLGPDFVSVNVEEGRDWALLKPEVYAVIMDFYASGKPVLVEGDADAEGAAAISSTTILPTDSEVVAMIKELIETRIRPAVQEDGGDIDYKSFDEQTGKVLVQMQGSCKGCASSAITLKNGIENMLMHYVPEVKSVEEFVDEEVESVSNEALKKLEEKLSKVTPIPTASPV